MAAIRCASSREQLPAYLATRLLFEIHVSKGLPGRVPDGEVAFLLVNGGRRRAERIERRWHGMQPPLGRRGP